MGIDICAFRLLPIVICVSLMAYGQAWGQEKEKDRAKPEFPPTHNQTGVIQVKGEKNSRIVLNSFCIDQQGNILAAVSNGVQRLDSDGKLIESFPLEFSAEAINQGTDGTIFVAGEGKLAKLSSEGKLDTVATAPWMKDKVALKKEAQKEAEEQAKRRIESSNLAIKKIQARIEELKEKENLDERAERQLEAFEKQLQSHEKILQSAEKSAKNPNMADALIRRRLKINAIGVNNDYCFVCAPGAGFGYDVWRLDLNFKQPEKIASKLGGCCGQCHIQVDGEHVIVAANTRFNVVRLNKDGKEVNAFGKRGDGEAGFSGCCNPMNVACCSDDTILTAESGAGLIKRFSKEGELLGIIGKASVAAGCKNVTIGYNKSLNRYYMLSFDKSQICILDPINESTNDVGSGKPLDD